ncbi:hypothetical protein DL766_000364 [Monosporascus sp. MC13-8B]|uniref:GMP synthase C-terminal domain-containing protein n=1 Tax=Monosporascus cannonballus TaxID=155416 RepID=A0ABY0HK26_9PEZI|nr:hypothetical protein DL762_001674 [Monosporascus cannonballus]RYP39542.1 hypothetical protein DL766_000364 [Monosporascus sp. MC13-8B]
MRTHPFLGPGIGIVIIDEYTPERVWIAHEAEQIHISMIREAGLYNEISQAYASVDTSQAVGFMGDKRHMGYIVILRAAQLYDGRGISLRHEVLERGGPGDP